MDGVMCLVKSKVRPMAVDGTLVSGKAVALSTAYVEAVNQLKGKRQVACAGTYEH
jgi:hypothetical protein